MNGTVTLITAVTVFTLSLANKIDHGGFYLLFKVFLSKEKLKVLNHEHEFLLFFILCNARFKCSLRNQEQGSSERRTLCDRTGRVPMKPASAAEQEETLSCYSFRTAAFIHLRKYCQVSDIHSVSPMGRYGTFLTDRAHL